MALSCRRPGRGHAYGEAVVADQEPPCSDHRGPPSLLMAASPSGSRKRTLGKVCRRASQARAPNYDPVTALPVVGFFVAA